MRCLIFLSFIFISSCQKPFLRDPIDSKSILSLIGSPDTCSYVLPAGTYKINQPLDSFNKITIDVSVLKVGTWTAFTDTVNGISFTGHGSFTTLGKQVIILKASGLPVKAGLNNFIINAGNNQCSFSLNVDTRVTPSTNIDPNANAGSDQLIMLPLDTVSLTGSGKDTDGFITTYFWRMIIGPGTPVIKNANKASTLINNLITGKYEFELTVTDNSGGTGKDTVSITVNEAPVTGSLAMQQELNIPNPVNDSMNYKDGKITTVTSNYHLERVVSYSNNRISNVDYLYHNPDGSLDKVLTHSYVYDGNGNVIKIYETQIPINTTFLHDEFIYNNNNTLRERKTHFLGGRILRDVVFLYTNGNLTTFINLTPDNRGTPDTVHITYDTRINTFNNLCPQYYLLDAQSDYYGTFCSEMFYFSKNYPTNFGVSSVLVSTDAATAKPYEITFNGILLLRYVYNK